MENRSDLAVSAEAGALVAAPQRPRRRYRQKLKTLTYVNLDQANGGIIRDLNETGVAIQALAPLRTNQQIHLRFELLNPRVRVETAGRVAWANTIGQAGVEFVNLPQRSQRLLKEWIFTQLLATAHQVSWDSIFIHHKRGEEATELRFSAAARPVIRLKPEEISSHALLDSKLQGDEKELRLEPLRLSWCPFPISPRGLSRLVDGLILTSAIFLFSVVAVALTHTFPPWPIALGLGIGATGMFVTLYWLLFVVWIGVTPGTRMAQLAASDSQNGKHEEEDRPRFR
jgi:hypothetical protein